MKAEEYFQIMEETGNYTFGIIHDYIHSIPEEGLRNFVKIFFAGRIRNKKRLRIMLVRAAYHILTGDESKDGWKKAKNLYAFAELWCIADYLTNDVFDNKLDKCKRKMPKDPNLFYMASSVVRELSQKALENSFEDFSTPLKARIKVLNKFSEIVKHAYLHQWVDYTEKYKEQSIKWLEKNLDNLFKKRYVEYQAGNVFGLILEIVCFVIDPKKKIERELLYQYGRYISEAMQIVNDIADITQGNYDLKNKLLTYPLILTMMKTGKNVYRLPSVKVISLFVNSRALAETREKAIKGRNNAKRALRKLKGYCRENLGIHILGSLTSAISSNKYYKKFEEL